MRIYYDLIKLLFPEKCVLCGKLLQKDETDLCRDCRSNVPEYGKEKSKMQFLDSFVAVWYYEKSVRRSLLRFKFRGARHYARCYGRLLAMKVQEEHPDGIDILTWVPVSPLRKLRRGYDQVELIAQAVGQELGIRPVPTLKKVRNNRPQSRLRDPAERKANVIGVYRAVEPETVSRMRVLLLDDILTTGATAGECARTLKSAGAKEVHCAAVAAVRK